MKKIKYLLGLLIVGVGLFINQFFAANAATFSQIIEAVTLPLTSSNYISSSNYKYTFSFIPNSWGYNYFPFLGYNLYYNSQYQYTFDYYQGSSSCPDLYSTKLLNSSFNYYSEFTGSCHYQGGNLRLYSSTNLPSVYGGYPLGPIPYGKYVRIVLGDGPNFGVNFVYAGDESLISPKYSLGGGYFITNDYKYLTSDDLAGSPLRIFFNQNVNLSSPLDGFDLATNSGSNITGSIAWQYYTQNSAIYRTKNQSSDKYIIDYGREGIKGLTFGGYGMGYTFAVNFSSDPGILQWGNWSFSNIGSRCIESAMNLGVTDFDTLTTSNCSSIGLLVLKGVSYANRNGNGSVVILGKNPNNYKQLLYEQFDCADDDILRIMDYDTGFCNSISHGYIVYSGSSDILPFENKQDTYIIGSGNAFLDFIFTNGLYGYTTISGNNYCINSSSSSFCFGLHATPQLISLKEMYLQNGGDIGGIGGTVTGALLDDIIINNPSDYYTYSGLLEIAGQSIFTSGFDVSGTGIYDGNFVSNGLGYTFINGVPALKEYYFGFCPFNSIFGEIEPTMSFEGFSFDLLSPFKCILTSFQYGFLKLNSPSLDSISTINLIINDESFSTFIWVILYGGLLVVCFKFLNKFI